MKVLTPKDIYEYLFEDNLALEMHRLRSLNFHVEAEFVLRVIEFLEKHLEKE